MPKISVVNLHTKSPSEYAPSEGAFRSKKVIYGHMLPSGKRKFSAGSFRTRQNGTWATKREVFLPWWPWVPWCPWGEAPPLTPDEDTVMMDFSRASAWLVNLCLAGSEKQRDTGVGTFMFWVSVTRFLPCCKNLTVSPFFLDVAADTVMVCTEVVAAFSPDDDCFFCWSAKAALSSSSSGLIKSPNSLSLSDNDTASRHIGSYMRK